MKQHLILYQGAFSALKILLEQGTSIKAESGAMVSMSDTIEVTGKLEGGVLGGIGRMLTGETFFLQSVTAKRGDGEIILAPSSPGHIACIELNGTEGYNVQKDGFFVGESSLKVATKMQNLAKGFLSGEGFFIVKVEGEGKLFISSFGAIHKIYLEEGQEYIVDNGHLVAWPQGMKYNIEKSSSGWIASLTSGEGLVTRFKGPGTIYIQTRNPSAFGGWVRKFLPITNS